MALSECGTITDLHDMELNQHGNSAFPIACYEDNLSEGNVPWHWHDEWEFAIVHEGLPDFLLENIQIPIKKGDGIFINGRALHAANDNLEQPGILHSAVFHPRLIGGNTDSIFWQTLVQPFMNDSSTRYVLLESGKQWAKEVLEHFENAWECVANDTDGYEITVRYELSAGIQKLLKHYDFSESRMSEQELINAQRIRTMLEYIEERYNEEITVEQLARTITSSESACLRCFHQMLHTTPMQYVKNLRLKKTADLLVNTNKSAKEIALMCGFNDISYFTRAFRAIYNKTPGEYRKSHR